MDQQGSRGKAGGGPLAQSMAALALAAVVVSGVSASAIAQQDDRPALVVAVQQHPPQLEPVMLSRISGWRLLVNAFDFLIETDYDADFTLQPGLATDWRRIDDHTVEVDIRSDVVMHDGRTMTVEDVAFSFGPERMLDEEAPGYGQSRAFMGTLERVDIVDDDTVRFITTEPDPLLIQRLGGWMSQVISREAFLEAPSFEDWSMAPVGTGPYRITDVVMGDVIRMEAHDDYWGGRPPYSAIEFVEVPELSARIAGLVAGDYDLITDVGPDQIEAITRYEDLDVVGGDTVLYRSVRFAVNHPVLANPLIRRALAHAIDRQAIADALWQGRVDVTNGFQFTYFNDMFIEDHEGPAYDPDLARALLAEAGYDGEPIPYHVQCCWYPVELPTSEAIAAMWEAVGFNIDIELQENWDNTLIENPAFIHNGATLMNIPDPVGAVWRLYGADSSVQRRNQWTNEEFNELGRILETSLDQDERRAAFARMLEIVDGEDLPGTALHMMGFFYGKRGDLDWQPTPAPYLDLGPR